MTQVGKDIEAICGKCGDVWHVVAAKVGNNIVKVVCKQCGVQHRYRPSDGQAAAQVSRRRESARAHTAAPRRVLSSKPLVEADLTQPMQPYRMTERYARGQRIEHPTFGLGIVEAELAAKKMQVYFESGRRVLAMATGTN